MHILCTFSKPGWEFCLGGLGGLGGLSGLGGLCALGMNKTIKLLGQAFFMPVLVIFMFLLASGMFNEQAFAAGERVAGEQVAGERATGEQNEQTPGEQASEQAPEQMPGDPAFIPEIQSGPEFDFRKTRWGMSIDEVKASEGRKPDYKDSRTSHKGTAIDSLGYLDINFLNYQGRLLYTFNEKKLIITSMHFHDFFKGKQLLSRLEKMFGPPVFKEESPEYEAQVGWIVGNSRLIIRNYSLKSKDKHTTVIILHSAEVDIPWGT